MCARVGFCASDRVFAPLDWPLVRGSPSGEARGAGWLVGRAVERPPTTAVRAGVRSSSRGATGWCGASPPAAWRSVHVAEHVRHRPPGRDQDPAPAVRRGRRVRAPLPRRGADGRHAGPPAHRRVDRHGLHGERRAVPRPRAPERPHPRAGGAVARTPADPARGAHRAADRLGAGRRARAGRRPPRPQERQRVPARARRRAITSRCSTSASRSSWRGAATPRRASCSARPGSCRPSRSTTPARSTRRCDIYSLGVILYEMLAGQVPFSDAPFPIVFSKILQEEPPPLVAFCPMASPELVAVVARAMAKSPARPDGQHGRARATRWTRSHDLALDRGPAPRGQPGRLRRRRLSGMFTPPPSTRAPTSGTAADRRGRPPTRGRPPAGGDADRADRPPTGAAPTSGRPRPMAGAHRRTPPDRRGRRSRAFTATGGPSSSRPRTASAGGRSPGWRSSRALVARDRGGRLVGDAARRIRPRGAERRHRRRGRRGRAAAPRGAPIGARGAAGAAATASSAGTAAARPTGRDPRRRRPTAPTTAGGSAGGADRAGRRGRRRGDAGGPARGGAATAAGGDRRRDDPGHRRGGAAEAGDAAAARAPGRAGGSSSRSARPCAARGPRSAARRIACRCGSGCRRADRPELVEVSAPGHASTEDRG